MFYLRLTTTTTIFVIFINQVVVFGFDLSLLKHCFSVKVLEVWFIYPIPTWTHQTYLESSSSWLGDSSDWLLTQGQYVPLLKANAISWLTPGKQAWIISLKFWHSQLVIVLLPASNAMHFHRRLCPDDILQPGTWQCGCPVVLLSCTWSVREPNCAVCQVTSCSVKWSQPFGFFGALVSLY